MTKLLINICILAFSSLCFAVEVPDFSFKGEEVSSFAINSGFQKVDIKFHLTSEYTNYIQKESIRIAEDKGGEYSSEEPSGIYNSRAGTALAAFFVGDKAYRNFLVKKYIQGSYADVISSYDKYSKNIKTPEFQEETRLLFHMSQIAMKNEAGRKGIFDICTEGGLYKNIACDRYTELLLSEQKLQELADNIDKIKRPIPIYTFSAAAIAAIQLEDYAKAEKMLAENPDLIFNYTDLNDLRAVVLYRHGQYSAVARLTPFTTDDVAFITADSLINLERFDEARPYVERVPEPDVFYLLAKLALAQKNDSTAISALQKITNDDERFDLLHYYAARSIPRMSDKVLNAFTFTDAEKKDYPSYYMGLQQMELKNYTNAVAAFNKVTAPKELVDQVKFYRGMSQVYIDPAKAEADIAYTLNYSTKQEEANTARFMLAQIYNMNGRTDEAAQLIDGCSESFCRQLSAEILLKQGNYSRALESIGDANTTQAHIIRATAHFNLKDYELAKEEVSKISTASNELTHLKMMLLFKDGNTAAATDMLTANTHYTPMLTDGVRELVLAGDYEIAGKLLEEQKNLSPEMQLEKANILAWSGDIDGAKGIYGGLIARKELLYEALSGLVDLEDTNGDRLKIMRTIMQNMPKYGDFADKDALLDELSKQAARAEDNVLLSNIINAFFPTYEDSAYAGAMYAARAKLFYTTGRYNECVQDIALASAKDAALYEELRYTKAQCVQEVDMAEALELYRDMFATDEQYRLLSAVKIMDNTEDAEEVLAVAEALEAENPGLYLEGVRRFMELAEPVVLAAHSGFLAELAESQDLSLKCAGLYGTARIYNEGARGRDAAKIYMQIYETAPKDHFAKPALNAALTIYEELDMTKEANAVRGIMK